MFIGTCIATAIATIAMGLFARYPFALAAGMGLNSVVAYSLILGIIVISTDCIKLARPFDHPLRHLLHVLKPPGHK